MLVNNEDIYNVCFHCKYFKSNIANCYKLCGSNTDYYYLRDQEAAKLEIPNSQKELLDLQIENKKLKEKCKSEYQRGVEDGKIIAEHGTTMYQD